MSDSELAAIWVSAIATSLAVIVALFKEEIRSWWHSPRLIAILRLEPPDCHKTEIALTNPGSGQVLAKGDCYYFRVWVENKGRQRAERVQVFVAKLLKKHADGKFYEDKHFLPMNLRWAHSPDPSRPEVFTDGISPQMGKHCDLGHIVEPQLRTKIPFTQSLPTVPANKTIFELDLEVQPNTLSHLLEPGTYRLNLRIAATNARPVDKWLQISVTGDWFPDQAKMLSQGIGISEG